MRTPLRSPHFALLAALLGACAPGFEQEEPTPSRVLLLDDVGTPPTSMELFVLNETALLPDVVRTLTSIGGQALHTHGKRLIVGRAPEGSDLVLRAAGVSQHFAGAVSPRELPNLGASEARFVRVFSSRYYPDTTPAGELVRPTRLEREEGVPFESAPEVVSKVRGSSVEGKGTGEPQNPEDTVWTPYAAGSVVVSIILPESNGVGEPSTEDWNEDLIVETYTKVQAALEAIARHEPNSRMRFIIHTESAPRVGALEGTVDVDYEYGKHARGGEALGKIYAQIYSAALGRPVTEGDSWLAQQEYLQGLKRRYDADGAFMVFVAANPNYTAGFRAYASLNGPLTALDSGYGFEVFMHEFGHIFGAHDEYCPDQCIPPSAPIGYLGVVNANAEFRAGSGGGIRGGRGESQPSLMMANIVNGVNGYARGAFGWVDSDGDGLLEVLDTVPESTLRTVIEGGEIRLRGSVRDVPATSAGATPYSVNRISALHVRKQGASDDSWVRLPLGERTRGREAVDLSLGLPRSGRYALEVRAENSVGNLEPTVKRVSFGVERGTNAAPLVALNVAPKIASPSATVTLKAQVLDLDDGNVRVRFDIDGDGRFDTAASETLSTSFRPSRAGLIQVSVEATDGRGARSIARAPLYVLERNVAAGAELAPMPSPLVGTANVRLAALATRTVDPEGGAVELNFEVEHDDAERSERVESGYSSRNAFDHDVETPPALAASSLDLLAIDYTLPESTPAHDAVRVAASVLAVALGDYGVALVDIADLRQPRLIARLLPETSAYDLELVKGFLYVLGDHLSVIDVRTPSAPQVVLQNTTTRARRRAENTDFSPIGEGSETDLKLQASHHERIERSRVEIALTHPAWHELLVTLEAPDRTRIVLWDHQRRPSGARSMIIDDTKNAALRALAGRPMVGEFRLHVLDDVNNGTSGAEITRALVDCNTAHRAYPLPRGPMSQVLGTLNERTLVLAGTGIESVDVTTPQSLRSVSHVATGSVVRGQLLGTRAIALTNQGVKGSSTLPRVRGLVAVDLARPTSPRVLRADTSVLGNALAVTGSRVYVGIAEKGRGTAIGDLTTFLSGQKYWISETDLTVGNYTFGDETSLWTSQGGFARIDFRNADAPVVLEQFADPIAQYAVFFDARFAVVLGAARELSLVDLGSRTSAISEVWRVTVKAKDRVGAISESSRTVHVVPYDHAPSVTSAHFTQATTTRDPYELEVRVSDPDEQPSWDSHLAVRLDWEGDGIWDGSWMSLWEVARFSHAYTQAGLYEVRLQARDGFHALSDIVTVPLEVVAYVPVACQASSQCPRGEYCEFGENSACGDNGAGTCERVRSDCYSIDPVCGCDGVSYRNGCAAQQAGSSIASVGFCPGEVTQCGGPAGAQCTVAGMFCQYPVGETPTASCGANQGFGECTFQPEGCFQPFGRSACGCDGQTYASDCEASRAGVSVQFYGNCEAGPDCVSAGCAAGDVCMFCFGGPRCMPEGSFCLAAS